MTKNGWRWSSARDPVTGRYQEKKSPKRSESIPITIPTPSHLITSTPPIPHFERLRAEDPVHYHENSLFGPYWSITTYKDIMFVDSHHDLFSSDQKKGGIALGGIPESDEALSLPMFISEDPPKFDLISMLAHDEATNNMDPQELLGNVMLLIVGGNDTTRNSISGGVLALNQNPDAGCRTRRQADQARRPGLHVVHPRQQRRGRD